MLRYVAGLLAGVVLLGACGGTAPHAAPEPTAPPGQATASGAPSATPTGDLVVTVRSVERGALGPDGHVAPGRGPGPEYWVEDARTCLPPDAPGPRTTGWSDWRLEELDGRRLVADPAQAPQLSRPAYPVHRELAPGQCARGWWAVPVPHGTVVAAVRFAPDGGPVLHWSSQ